MTSPERVAPRISVLRPEWRSDEAERFTEAQVIGILEAEAGAETADLARKHAVSEHTIDRWKAKYGGNGERGAKTQAARG